jgi:hypothetical protein
MSVKCPKCRFDNPTDTHFCGKCGTLLRSVRGTDPTDVGPDPRSGSSSDDIPVSHTKTLEIPAEDLSRGTLFSRVGGE